MGKRKHRSRSNSSSRRKGHKHSKSRRKSRDTSRDSHHRNSTRHSRDTTRSRSRSIPSGNSPSLPNDILSQILEKLSRQEERLHCIEVMTSAGEPLPSTEILASDHQLTEEETVPQNRGSEPGMSPRRPSYPIFIGFVAKSGHNRLLSSQHFLSKSFRSRSRR